MRFISFSIHHVKPIHHFMLKGKKEGVDEKTWPESKTENHYYHLSFIFAYQSIIHSRNAKWHSTFMCLCQTLDYITPLLGSFIMKWIINSFELMLLMSHHIDISIHVEDIRCHTLFWLALVKVPFYDFSRRDSMMLQ